MFCRSALVIGLILLVADQSAVGQLYSGYRYREQIVVVPPGVPRIVTVTPWGYYDLLGGYTYNCPSVPQPTGHRITPTGPNGYVYEPVYSAPPLGAPPGSTVVERPLAPQSPIPATPQALATNAMLREMLTAFRAARYDEVVSRCEAALIDDPRAGAIHLLQSHALFALARYDESAGALRRGLSVLEESHWSLLIGERDQFYPAGAYDAALDKLRQFVVAQPNDAAARLLLGYQLGGVGRTVEARKQFEAVRQLDPAEELSPRLLRRWPGN